MNRTVPRETKIAAWIMGVTGFLMLLYPVSGILNRGGTYTLLKPADVLIDTIIFVEPTGSPIDLILFEFAQLAPLTLGIRNHFVEFYPFIIYVSIIGLILIVFSHFLLKNKKPFWLIAIIFYFFLCLETFFFLPSDFAYSISRLKITFLLRSFSIFVPLALLFSNRKFYWQKNI